LKQLLLVRHAKSDWDDPELSDIERPLNERGKRDAPMMAERLFSNKLIVDAFITSTAKRARKTAKTFFTTYNRSAASWIETADLYLAPPETFRSIIKTLDNRLHTVMIFAHNPGITDFANELTNARIDNMPTCSIFAVRVQADQWFDFDEAEKSFWFFDYPKNLEP